MAMSRQELADAAPTIAAEAKRLQAQNARLHAALGAMVAVFGPVVARLSGIARRPNEGVTTYVRADVLDAAQVVTAQARELLELRNG